MISLVTFGSPLRMSANKYYDSSYWKEVIARGGTIEGRLKLCDTLSGVFKKCQKNKKKLKLNKNTKKI